MITLPLLAGAVGPELLGLWMSVLAMAAVGSCINTGISAAIVTSIASGQTTEEVVRDSAILAICCSIATMALGFTAIWLIDFHKLFGLTADVDPIEVSKILALVTISLSIGFAGNLGRFVAIGRGEGYRAQIIDVVALFFGAATLISAIHMGSSISLLVTSFIFLPVVVTLAMSIAYLIRGGYITAPDYRIKYQNLKEKARYAIPMCLHQGLLAVSQHGDVLIIGIFISPVEAAFYGVGQRLCALVNFLVVPINHAFWPELIALSADHNVHGLRRYFCIQLAIALAIAIGFAIATVLFGNYLIGFWMGADWQIESNLLVGLSLGIVSVAFITAIEMLLRAQRQFNFLFRWTLIGVVVSTLAKGFSAHTVGVLGVAWAGPIVMALFVGVPYCIRVYYSSLFESVPTIREVRD